MRMPRWLMISMWCVSAFGLVGAAAWWWVTWPEYTAREFIAMLNEGKFEDAKLMVKPNSEIRTMPAYVLSDDLAGGSAVTRLPAKEIRVAKVTLVEPTFNDWILGRRTYCIFDQHFESAPHRTVLAKLKVEAQWGSIRICEPTIPFPDEPALPDVYWRK